jgi:hypothetical protein
VPPPQRVPVTNVGVSICINRRGVNGRIGIGNYPQPALVAPQPIVVAPAPLTVYQQPIYLNAPVVYQQSWSRYCERYYAQLVCFVQEQWVCERNLQEHDSERGERHERHHDGDGRYHHRE